MARWRFPNADPEEGWPYPDEDPVDADAEAEALEPRPPVPPDPARHIIRQDPICQAFGHTSDREGYGACPSCGGDWPW